MPNCRASSIRGNTDVPERLPRAALASRVFQVRSTDNSPIYLAQGRQQPSQSRNRSLAMTPLIDPRLGDVEDDASSTKRRSLFAMAGSLLAEISFPKLILSWVLLILLPAMLLGLTPLIVSGWLATLSRKVAALFSGSWPVSLLLVVVVLGWIGGRPLLRAAEQGFWSLNSVVVQPGYALCRECLRHLIERLVMRDGAANPTRLRSATAAGAGLILCGVGLGVVVLAWPASRWIGTIEDLASPHRLLVPALANAAVLLGRLPGGGRACLGHRRRGDAPTPRPPRVRSDAGGRQDLARCASFGPAHRRRALRISHRERAVRSARQRQAHPGVGASGAGAQASALRHCPRHRRRDRRGPLGGVGGISRGLAQVSATRRGECSFCRATTTSMSSTAPILLASICRRVPEGGCVSCALCRRWPRCRAARCASSIRKRGSSATRSTMPWPLTDPRWSNSPMPGRCAFRRDWRRSGRTPFRW